MAEFVTSLIIERRAAVFDTLKDAEMVVNLATKFAEKHKINLTFITVQFETKTEVTAVKHAQSDEN